MSRRCRVVSTVSQIKRKSDVPTSTLYRHAHVLVCVQRRRMRVNSLLEMPFKTQSSVAKRFLESSIVHKYRTHYPVRASGIWCTGERRGEPTRTIFEIVGSLSFRYLNVGWNPLDFYGPRFWTQAFWFLMCELKRTVNENLTREQRIAARSQQTDSREMKKDYVVENVFFYVSTRRKSSISPKVRFITRVVRQENSKRWTVGSRCCRTFYQF